MCVLCELLLTSFIEDKNIASIYAKVQTVQIFYLMNLEIHSYIAK